ncbi:MAG: cytochrome ubiquinol oxidase subunit I, partial [Candidatus Electrothrix sp. ATG2]|nr:cytochrome ubiquinol oxidase subunit I [Candidatus Electrothrix sp. ATG2]
MEGLYQGEKGADLIAFGMLNSAKKIGDDQEPFSFVVKVPGLLSLLANRSLGSFVPGMEDLVYGNKAENIMGAEEKITKGKAALTQLDA